MSHISNVALRRVAAALLALSSLVVVWALLSRRDYKPLEAMPSQTALAFFFHGTDGFENTLNSAPSTWRKLAIVKTGQEDLRLAADIFRTDSGLSRVLLQNACAAGLSLHAPDSLHAIFALDGFDAIAFENVLRKSAEQGFRTEKRQLRGQVYHIIYKTPSEYLVVTGLRNLFLFSRYSYLVEDAVLHSEKKRSLWAKAACSPSAETADFRLILAMETLAERCNHLLADPWMTIMASLPVHLEWIDIFHAPDGWQMKGDFGKGNMPVVQASIDDSGFWAVLPDNTAFTTGLSIPVSAAKGASSFTYLPDRDFLDFLQPWAGPLAAYVLQEPFSREMTEDQCLIFSVRDARLATQLLDEYGKKRGVLKQYDYQTFTIEQYLSPALLGGFAGSKALRLQNPAVVRLGEYAVFASSTSVLELWVDKYIVSQTLANLPEFLLLQQKSAGAPVSFYFNSRYLTQISRKLLPVEAGHKLRHDLLQLQQSGLLGAFIKQEAAGIVQAGLIRQALSRQTPGVRILWKAPLAGEAGTQPFILKSAAEDGDPLILIQDDHFVLHCFNLNGNSLWQKQLDKPVISEIHGIDYYGNGRVCLLFNTATEIWLLDEAGKEIAGYPLRLHSPATNGISVVDFDDSRRYSFFVACFNGNLYGMDQFGRPLAGWNPQTGVDRTVHPVLHFRHDTKDYLVVQSISGKLSVFNRDGTAHFAPKELEGNFGVNPPQVEASGPSPRIICLNAAGRMYTCDLAGNVVTFEFALPPADQPPMLVADDLSGDERSELALLTGNVISVYDNQGRSPRLSAKIESGVMEGILWRPGNGLLGTLNREKHQVRLFDGTGKIFPGFPLAGTTRYSLLQASADTQELLLLVGNRSELYAYRLIRPIGNQ